MSGEQESAVEEVWAYAGRRLMSDGSIGYAWVDDEGRGKESVWDRNPKAVIGYLYKRRIVRFEESMRVFGEPVLVGQSWSGPERIDDQRPVWNAKDEVAAQHLARKRMHNAAAKQETDLDAVMKPLLEVAAQLRTGAERDALTAFVIRRMNEIWFKGKSGGVK